MNLAENKKALFDNMPNFKKVVLEKYEFDEARKIENEANFEVSFYDIIHMILARKTNSVLITRGKRLMKIAKKYNVGISLPEDVIK